MARRKITNPTAQMIENGLLRFTRRVDFPMWHPDHPVKVARLLRQAADALDEVERDTRLGKADRLLYHQTTIMKMNYDASQLKPTNPRDRGSAMYEYRGSKLVDMNGVETARNHPDLIEAERKQFRHRKDFIKNSFIGPIGNEGNRNIKTKQMNMRITGNKEGL